MNEAIEVLPALTLSLILSVTLWIIDRRAEVREARAKREAQQ